MWCIDFAWTVQDGGYHVPFAHKGLAAGLDMGSYAGVLYERASIQSVQSADGADKRLAGVRPCFHGLRPLGFSS